MIAGIAASVRSGAVKAVDLAQSALDRIAADNSRINAATQLLGNRALTEAAQVDAAVAAGRDPGPLAGVPYGVKDLFDVAGLPTTAGAAVRADAAPAAQDADAVRLLSAAGAVLVATLNMDEFAYGFVTDNAHWGATRNPHDPARFAGGSSGGSAAAVAAGMLPFALGSDTNGSVRVPASLCGTWGIKPTHGGLPIAGVFPFVDSFDDIGPLTATAADCALVTAVLRGADVATPAPLRAARLGGWFARHLAPEMEAALAALAAALGAPMVALEGVAQARSAAFLMTGYEGGRLHLPELRSKALGYDPAVRDRLLAGAALPEAAYREALAYREVFLARILSLFGDADVLIAPSTYGPAPLIADPFIPIDGKPSPARANLGLYTQPISFVGLPVVAAPLRVEGLPMGVQLIGRPGSDAALLAFASWCEAEALLGAL